MAKEPRGRLAEVTGTGVHIDPAEHYDGWAETYDDELVNEYGYIGPRLGAEALAQALPDRDAPVIDVGCGTGLVGIELVRHGFTALDGVDISRNMLAMAGKTGAYRRLIHQDAEKGPVIAEGTYAAAICIGAFGAGHLGPKALAGLIRMAQPGGPVVIVMNAQHYVSEGFDAEVKRLEAEGVWKLERVEDHNYMDAIVRPGKLIVAKRG